MEMDPASESRQLIETYRAMFDGELELLAADINDLTEPAREILRAEMKQRGLPMPGDKPATPRRPPSQLSGVALEPDAIGGEFDDGADQGEPSEFTWKVPLCACASDAEAQVIRDALRKDHIDCWVQMSDSRIGGAIVIVVAADQLEEAREIAARPISQASLDEYNTPIEEYEVPRCPECGEEDPILEGAGPTNSWLCEACGHQWTDPADGPEAVG